MDLICIKDAVAVDEGIGVCDVLYVQCKTNGRISQPELVELVEHSNKYNARAILAYKDKKKHIICELLN